ncbi:hypothetical protein BKA63DRAFT_111551 [Paraphoma chrysanthemicola]|nr:hypothetical protein BKA63DRAFT_111551 [Paraphoma chrysanthemicola]
MCGRHELSGGISFSLVGTTTAHVVLNLRIHLFVIALAIFIWDLIFFGLAWADVDELTRDRDVLSNGLRGAEVFISFIPMRFSISMDIIKFFSSLCRCAVLHGEVIVMFKQRGSWRRKVHDCVDMVGCMLNGRIHPYYKLDPRYKRAK